MTGPRPCTSLKGPGQVCGRAGGSGEGPQGGTLLLLLLLLPPLEGGQGESYGTLAGGLALRVRALGFLGRG